MKHEWNEEEYKYWMGHYSFEEEPDYEEPEDEEPEWQWELAK